MDHPEDQHDAASIGFDRFYRRELGGQVRRATLLLGSEAAASDAVHDCFVAIFKRWGTIDEPGPYLERSVLNRCRDVAKRRARKDRALRRLRVDADRPEHDVLWDVLSRLPFNQRAAVVLRFYEGMTEAEIADAINCAPGSVGPWISRALTAMRKELS